MIENKYQFKNDFLKGIIGSYYSNEIHIPGFTHGKGTGSALLTYYVKKAFNIQRFLFCEDRHFSTSFFRNSYNFEEIEDTLLNHIPKNEDELVSEIKDIYKFTQNNTELDTVLLYRNLENEYAAILLQLKNNAITQDLDYIEISTDILNSFTINSGTYGKDACIKFEIPKEDILYYSECFYEVMETEEYVVLNRNPYGLMKIPVGAIEKTNPSFDESKYKKIDTMKNKYYNILTSTNTITFETFSFKKPTLYKKESLICKVLKLLKCK